ncbi:DUF4260 family protein [Actinomadura sp. 7K534]|nr:DUF4260 family protein [Actinomadura sp. 7K534]TDB99096.1 DUF4260 family protein [Actinomadura sp. 7K534]
MTGQVRVTQRVEAAFHVGVDRALGYGLKLPDSFRHTHLGEIGKNPPHG